MAQENTMKYVILALFVFSGLMLVLLILFPPVTSEDIVYEVESPYQTIYVSEKDGIRSLHAGSLRNETSAMDLGKLDRHVYKYTELMMVALGYVENPESFLVVGLGGGTVTRALRLFYPDAEITNIEFDPEIVNVARKFFHYAEDERMRLVVQDARRWLLNSRERFDIIFLDAYHGGYIPFHLMTREFLEIVRERLRPGGIVCANTWLRQKLAHRESATYHAVFGDFHQYLAKRKSNRIIVASPEDLPEMTSVTERLSELERRHASKDFDFIDLQSSHFKQGWSWPRKTRILTDDHAPVNLLKEEG